MDNQISVSAEQQCYIEFTGLEDTKLLATAGSGKTFCIIQHIKHLTENGIMDPEGIYMLTFSKNAKDDFQMKVRKADATKNIPVKHICTIDSFAYRMLGPDISKDIDVSLLSFAWLDELKTHKKHDLLIKYPILNEIRMVFVDEAQDLNEIQYNILIRMKEVCPRLTLHMIGDPNQNIYQFRKASDRFLVQFNAKTFHLTKNFRSQAHIVDFCSHLRPYNDTEISSSQPKKSLDVTFYAYENHNMFEHMILSILHLFQAKQIPLHKCAILAPTRGYIRDTYGACRYKGLCYIANLLYQHKIPFTQFYNDVGSNSDQEISNKINYKPLRGAINLMTYTSSKGLEWDYVIIIDANAHLISRVNYDNDKYQAERYLLYVACSRPRKNLIVFTKRKYANPWFKDVPKEKYKIAKYCEDSFDFFDTSLLFNAPVPIQLDQQALPVPQEVVTRNVKNILHQLEMEELYHIQKSLRGKVNVQQMVTSTSAIKFPDIRHAFANQFSMHLFYAHSTKGPLPESHAYVRDVHNIITHKNVILCPSERVISWYYDNRQEMTWETWESTKSSLDARVVKFVEQHFDKAKEFAAFTLIDRFYDIYVHRRIADIQKLYENYVADQSPENVLALTRIAYAIRSTHYFYIEQDAIFTKDFMEGNQPYYDALRELAEKMSVSKINQTATLDGTALALSNIDYARNNKPIYMCFGEGLNIKDTILSLLFAKATGHSCCYTIHLKDATFKKLTFDDLSPCAKMIIDILKNKIPPSM